MGLGPWAFVALIVSHADILNTLMATITLEFTARDARSASSGIVALTLSLAVTVHMGCFMSQAHLFSVLNTTKLYLPYRNSYLVDMVVTIGCDKQYLHPCYKLVTTLSRP